MQFALLKKSPRGKQPYYTQSPMTYKELQMYNVCVNYGSEANFEPIVTGHVHNLKQTFIENFQIFEKLSNNGGQTHFHLVSYILMAFLRFFQCIYQLFYSNFWHKFGLIDVETRRFQANYKGQIFKFSNPKAKPWLAFGLT